MNSRLKSVPPHLLLQRAEVAPPLGVDHVVGETLYFIFSPRHTIHYWNTAPERPPARNN